jgi:hypothetical protein
VTDPYVAFERDVPKHLQDDALQAMAEATGGYGSPVNVTILDRDQLDAINFRAGGIIEIEGREFTFQFEDGNWNGSVLLAWESDRPFERHEPTRWAIQPKQHLVWDAINAGRGPFLIAKWDIMIGRPEIAKIVGNYAYDRFFQPGGQIEKHYHALADKHHFEIVSQEDADRTRARLAEATEAYPS